MTLTEFLLARIAEDYDADLPDVRSAQRMLAECEAKRRIVEEYERSDRAFPTESSPPGEQEHRYERFRVAGLGYALRMLALPYADHPDYREGWKP